MSDSLPQKDSSDTRWYSLRGRAGRSEFWGWILKMIPICLFGGLFMIGGLILLELYRSNGGAGGSVFSIAYAVAVTILCTLPFCLMLNRRLRDIGLVGWLAFVAWANLLASVAITAYVVPPMVNEVLTTCAPIAEHYNAERAQLHLQYKDKPTIYRLAKTHTDECEEAELKQATIGITDHWLKTEGDAVFMLESTMKINGGVILIIIILGFLPPCRGRLRGMKKVLLYNLMLILVVWPPAIVRCYRTYNELNNEQFNQLANVSKDYGFYVGNELPPEEREQAEEQYRNTCDRIRAEMRVRLLQSFDEERKKYPLMSIIRITCLSVCFFIFITRICYFLRYRLTRKKS